ncbi:unnamed protein product [Soboliphyme baturini]|uniref:Uncharacterized protein n=1 Tax=Soboliphyme baturini TaxID=241478 RepID=A0A183IIP2_9BILA|nr:unnamed protein product [Soboliphyme baturini]
MKAVERVLEARRSKSALLTTLSPSPQIDNVIAFQVNFLLLDDNAHVSDGASMVHVLSGGLPLALTKDDENLTHGQLLPDGSRTKKGPELNHSDFISDSTPRKLRLSIAPRCRPRSAAGEDISGRGGIPRGG